MSEVITITFGECSVTHIGMDECGYKCQFGFWLDDLLMAKENFEEIGCVCEIVDLKSPLNGKIKESIYESIDDAYVLVVRNAVDRLLKMNPRFAGKGVADLHKELLHHAWDKKYFDKRRSKVLNKRARYNVCFDDMAGIENYEKGQGTTIAWAQSPILKAIRDFFPELIGEKATNLKAEGNLYYDLRNCGIGYHGDTERLRVIGVRSGSAMPIYYQWYHQNNRVGERIPIDLYAGDLYIMSEKTTGSDWKRSSLYTLRHATGADKYTK